MKLLKKKRKSWEMYKILLPPFTEISMTWPTALPPWTEKFLHLSESQLEAGGTLRRGDGRELNEGPYYSCVGRVSRNKELLPLLLLKGFGVGNTCWNSVRALTVGEGYLTGIVAYDRGTQLLLQPLPGRKRARSAAGASDWPYSIGSQRTRELIWDNPWRSVCWQKLR